MKPIAAHPTLALFVLSLAATTAGALDDQERGAVLYTDTGFRGYAERVVRDDPSLDDNPIGDDQVSSVRVDSGCRVRLYQQSGFRGPFVEVRGSERELARTAIGNDAVRSVKVRCGWSRDWGDDEPPARYDRPDEPRYDGPDRDRPRDADRRGGRYDRPPATPGHSPYGRHRGEGATLYRDVGFRGTSEQVNGNIASLGDTRIGNDALTSIRLGRGCWARLFDDAGFRGSFVDLRFDEADLGQTPIGNDRVSSIQVRCRGDHRRPDRDGRGVVLYRDAGFRGTREVVDGDVPDLGATRIGNDALSSIEVPPGCVARLFENGEFRGAYFDVTENVPELRRANDRISSVRVRCGSGRYGVTLYRDDDFRGEAETFTGDVYDLRRTRIGNDQASSIEVDPGCEAVLFADTDFRGPSVELRYDVDSLRDTPVGNDRVSSLQVRCR